MSVFFTSDLHLGHEKVADIRGFSSPEAHDAAIVDAWRSVVQRGDQVWVLGDLAVSSPSRALRIIAELPGDKHLIWGNHDLGHPMHRDAHRKAAKYLEAFASAQTFARRRVLGQEVLLSHFPYLGDTEGREVDRHTQYRLRDEGLPIIHGHTHSSSKTSMSFDVRTYTGTGALQLHVGLDAHDMQLVPLSQIEARFRVRYNLED